MLIKRRAIVRLFHKGKDQPVGVLEETDSGTTFTYSKKWLDAKSARPISLTLPLREAPYVWEDEEERVHPFFSNLLPGNVYRQVMATDKNLFAALLEHGADCKGAVSLIPDWNDSDTLFDRAMFALDQSIQIDERTLQKTLDYIQGFQGLSPEDLKAKIQLEEAKWEAKIKLSNEAYDAGIDLRAPPKND